MGTGNDDFSNQIEALVFKVRTGCTQLVKLLGYGLLCGTLVGAVASIFARGIDAGTAFRESHPWVIFLMPVGNRVSGIASVGHLPDAGRRGIDRILLPEI